MPRTAACVRVERVEQHLLQHTTRHMQPGRDGPGRRATYAELMNSYLPLYVANATTLRA